MSAWKRQLWIKARRSRVELTIVLICIIVTTYMTLQNVKYTNKQSETAASSSAHHRGRRQDFDEQQHDNPETIESRDDYANEDVPSSSLSFEDACVRPGGCEDGDIEVVVYNRVPKCASRSVLRLMNLMRKPNDFEVYNVKPPNPERMFLKDTRVGLSKRKMNVNQRR